MASIVHRYCSSTLANCSCVPSSCPVRRGDVKEAFRGAHTLKGVCQNLGFSNLYAPTYTLTETLRAGQLEGTQEQFAKVAEQYKRTVDAIRALD